MALIEWQGQVRITIGEISRAGQLDLWVMHSQSDWANTSKERNNLDYTLQLMDTDAMVAAVATRKIEICKGGKWVQLKQGETQTVQADGDAFELSFPAKYTDINHCPRSLGDQWIEAGVQRNGSFSQNMTFFSSLSVTSGKTNSEPESAALPSNTPETATS